MLIEFITADIQLIFLAEYVTILRFPRVLSNMQFAKVNLQCSIACRLLIALVLQTNSKAS